MDAYIDAYVVRGTVDSDEIDLYGACDHFFSLEHAKLLKDCASVAEFNLKKEIFGIELDPLLLTEIEDGFNECEIATSKMLEYAIQIHHVLYPMNEEVMTLPLAIDISRLPLAIDISRHSSTEKYSPVMIEVSHNFHRMSAYIKNNKSAYSKYTKTNNYEASWKKQMI